MRTLNRTRLNTDYNTGSVQKAVWVRECGTQKVPRWYPEGIQKVTDGCLGQPEQAIRQAQATRPRLQDSTPIPPTVMY